MSILEALKRGWWSGWAEFPELLAGGAGLLESLIPGDTPDDPLERLKNWGNEAAQGLRLEGGEGRSQGLLEKIAEGVGAAPGTVASMAPFMWGGGAAIGGRAAARTIGGKILGPAIGFGAHGLVRHGDEGLPRALGYGLRGAAEGAAFGGIGAATSKMFVPSAAEKILEARRGLAAYAAETPGKMAQKEAVQRFLGKQLEESGVNTLGRNLQRRALHGLGAGGVVGGMTAIHGGSTEDAVAGAATMGLLGMLSSGKYREPALTQEQAIAEVGKQIKERAGKREIVKEELATKQAPTEPSLVDEYLRSKAPNDPRRTVYDRGQFDKLSPEQQAAELDFYAKNNGRHAGYTDAVLRRGVKEGEESGRIGPFDAYKAEVELNAINKELADIEVRKLQIENGEGSITELEYIAQKEKALLVDQLASLHVARGSRSVSGSTLNAIKLARRGEPDWFKAVENWEKSVGKKMSDQVIKLARLSNGDPEGLYRLGHAIDTPKLWDYVQEYWINGLLSGIPTQLVNTSSNALRQGIDIVEKGAASLWEAKKGDISSSEAATIMGADIKAGWNTVKLFGPMMKLLINENKRAEFLEKYPQYAMHLERTKLDHPTTAIPGGLGQVIRLPGQVLQAMDIYFKAIAGDRAAAYTAYRMAIDAMHKGEIKPEQIEGRVKKLMGANGEPDLAILDAMKKEAERQTFTTSLREAPLSGFTAPLMKARNAPVNLPLIGEIRPGVGVIPFVQTPWNVITQSIARSPLGLLRMKSLKSRYESGEIKPQEYYREVSGTLMGTALWGGLLALAKSGVITGSGPTNYADRQNLLATGWRPYSIKLGDTYWQMQRLEPFGTVLGMAGDAAELGSSDDKMGKAIAMIKENMTNKSFLYGLESFAQAFANPEQMGSTYYRQMSGSIVPTFFSKLAQAVDPYQRIQEPLGAEAGIPDAMAYRVPFVSRALPARSTAMGEPAERWGVASTEGTFGKMFSAAQSLTLPIPISVARPNTEVEKELDRLKGYGDVPPSTPRRNKKIVLKGVTGENVKLTDEEYAVYDRWHQKAKVHLSRVISSPTYDRVPDAMKAKMLRSIYDKYRDAANSEITMLVRRRTSVGR